MTILGRLGTAPEERDMGTTGKKIISYNLATGFGPRDNRKTTWFRVSSFADGPRRDFLLSLPKGTLLHVEAEAHIDTWEGDDGQKQSVLRLNEKNIILVQRPREKNQGEDVPVEGDEGLVQ
jgi:single-stranded DNA-binding protein